MKIGLMGGTFDPIHYGHLFIAEEARTKLGLAKVMFIPAGYPPHKQGTYISPASQRIEMVSLAVRNNPFFELSEIEAKSREVSFTIETIFRVKKVLPEGFSLCLIMGSDSLGELGTWKDPERILDECIVAAVRRPGHGMPELKESQKGKVILLDTQGIEVSSTEIRRRVEKGESIRYLVPDDVVSYIVSEGLYRPKVES